MLFAVLLIWGAILTNNKKIYPNVRIADIEVGGMSRSAALGEVEYFLEEAYEQTLEVRLPDRILAFEPDEVNVSVNVEEAVDLAMSYGRSNGPIKAVFNYLSASGKPRNIELDMAIEMDTDYIEDVITLAANDISSKPVHSDVELTEGEITIVKGTPGYSLDQEALFEAVHTAYIKGDFTPIVWDYAEEPYVEVDLEGLHASMDSQTEDAYYDEEAHEIVEEVIGYGFDLEKEQQRLQTADHGDTLTIVLDEILPEITAEQLNAEMFGDKLESRSSPYVNNANRTENLRIACESINGMIINPGEVFSFNDAVGERTEERGFKPATIYGGEGESVDGTGGGICQVASTIYYTTLYMDLEQVMREPHMYQVTYVPGGMDATVYWDSGLDYKFRNNREHPIKIQANVDGGHVNITFWGVKENDNYVEMTFAVLETYTSEDVEEVDETKEPGFREQKQTAYVGAKVETYQKVYDGNGKLLKEKTVTSVYKSRPNIYIVGPEEEGPLDPDDPRLDPNSPEYDPTLDPNSPEYIPQPDPDLPGEDEELPWPDEGELPWPEEDEEFWP